MICGGLDVLWGWVYGSDIDIVVRTNWDWREQGNSEEWKKPKSFLRMCELWVAIQWIVWK